MKRIAMKRCFASAAWTLGRVHTTRLVLTLMVGTLLAATNSVQAQGDVYTSTNSLFGNSVVMFNRAMNGTLTPIGSFFTGGMGTGSGLGNAGAVIISPNHKFLYAVDAGSNDIAAFAIRAHGLQWLSNTASGGAKPISLTAHGDLLYVLNAGADNITGFTINSDGTLAALVSSTQPLSGTGTGSAQVEFSPNGELLVVTEKATNKIDVFSVDNSGLASAPIVTSSFGATPFGFDFDPSGHLIVSEAFGGAPGASAVSSYFVSGYGSLPITGSAQDGQSAACWIAVSKAGNYAWTTNTGSGNVSAYNIAPNGRLSLLAGTGIVANLGAGTKPTDMAMDARKRYLYVLESGSGAIAAFGVEWDGSLTALGVAGDLGPGMTGLAAR